MCIMLHMRTSVTTITLVATLLLGGCAVQDATATTPAPGATPATSSLIAYASEPSDLQVTGSIASPQVILTTQPAYFDGGPVRVDFDAEYANMIPDPASQLNGIGFELYVDGVICERIGLFGSHSQVSLFGPIDLTDVLVGTRAPTAGTHTISIGVWKWSASGDGYLKSTSGVTKTMPVQVTVTRV